jgi:hypothetical protein
VKQEGKWGFINKQGSFVIPPRYESVSYFSEGLAYVKDGITSGYIDQSGVMKFAAKDGGPFSEGFAVVGDRQIGFAFIDRTGEQAFPRSFQEADRFFHGLAHVKLSGDNFDGEFAYIDGTGKRVFTYRGRL